MRLLALIAVAILIAGCGDDAEPLGTVVQTATPAPKVVTAKLLLDIPAAGPPDAGTQGGHRAGAARGETSEATFSFDGIVSPARAEVTAQGAAAQVEPVGDHGDFTVTVRRLAKGHNRLTLRATADGYEPWEQDVVITRR